MPEAWTFRTLLDDMARRGQAPALIVMRAGRSHTITFEELVKHTRALVSRLLEQGVGPGEAVALLAPNGFEWIMGRLALGAIGAMAVAIDELATDGELRAILSSSGATRVLCQSSHAEALRRSNPALIIIGLDDETEGVRRIDTLFAAEAQRLPEISETAPAMLAYTSGTTGTPKAIVLTHSNIETNVRALVASRLVGPGDRVLLPLPLPHVYPFVVGLLVPLGSCVTGRTHTVLQYGGSIIASFA